ncbi:LOW QUALITY PROTEIN: coiled-coil domain-containing protein 81 [Dermochelys coriacea]|uniref:LOW QUALITY PROTEIN: coiled-coil domain-containing protein 81 n=1 Tax=Dermochelys coriacea TaxID=27794 RepID=UPI0018E70275|nr:LOW QUALITY PROTEIN: coiled-coil domain-containing protein 81 [Dermochelys coriacea]
MLDNIHAAILESGKSVFPTLPKLTADEVFSIWANVSEFVERQLSMNKGVQIPGLGTFSFLRQKLDVGNNKFILIRRPVFLLSEKLAQIHGLKLAKIHTPGDIPIIQLNFIMLSLEGPFNREIVEGCVKETLLFFSRSIAIKQNVEFAFKGIGVLVIRDNKVKMKFYKDFLQAMDGSGNLVNALSNRPGTGDSVISGRETAMSQSCGCSVVMFPRIELKETDNKAAMETIIEEREKSNKEKEPIEKERTYSYSSSKKENLPIKRLLSRQSIVPAKVSGFNLTDELEKNIKQKNAPESATSSAPPCFSKTEMDCGPNLIHATRPRTPSPLCQDHGGAGQEMCYLCMQRAQRNIPAYFSEERRRKELDDDRILVQYQTMKDQEALHRQQMKFLANREQNQKNAAFNLGVAEAMRNHKNEKSTEFHKSFVFVKRPPSPPPYAKQEEYSQDLLKQMEDKKEKEAKLKEDKELMDRLERVQLAEELAAQRAKYLKGKMEEMQCYKRALDTQIKLKPIQLPVCEPDSADLIFGKSDMTNEKLAEKRHRAQEFYKHQLHSAAQQKRTAIVNQLVEQRREADMLQRAKREWITDRGAQFEKIFQMNLAMQDDWQKSAGMKRLREIEEKLFERAGDKLMLLDQCERYRRCFQCKRRTTNCGESNVWSESRYVPGSRLMV